MGLYRDQIAFLEEAHSTWPRPLRRAVHVRINQLPPGNLELTLRIEYESKVLFEHSGVFTQEPTSPKSELNLNANLAIQIPGYGQVTTLIRVKNEAGELLLEKTRSLMIVAAKETPEA